MNGTRTGERFGAWEMESFIGSGGSGDVYLARRVDGVVEAVAAAKFAPCSSPLFSEEGELLRSLHHRNIAACFHHEILIDGCACIVMEHVNGLPITVHADQRGLSISERLALFLKLCDAVDYSHRHLVAHLDLKPGNILVTAEGSLKLVDFGAGHHMSTRITRAALSGPYASPEQLQPGHRVGYAADIYGLGSVLYELLCGHAPFNPALARDELERQILDVTPEPPSRAIMRSRITTAGSGHAFRLEPDTSARMRGGWHPRELCKMLAGDLDKICLFALRKEPNRRYRSVENLRSDIEAVLHGRKARIARSGNPAYSVIGVARRRPFVFVAAAAAAYLPYADWGVEKSSSNAIRSGYETAHIVDQVIESTLKDLDQVRLQIPATSELGPALEAVSAVNREAAPPLRRTTFWTNYRAHRQSIKASLWELVGGRE